MASISNNSSGAFTAPFEVVSGAATGNGSAFGGVFKVDSGASFKLVNTLRLNGDLIIQSGATLDLGERVRFLGRIDEAAKLALLRRAWALVLASPKEGWGITNLEAAACGTPVVASNSPGIRESVRDGETGYLVTHGDVQAMSAAMHRLAADSALVDRLGVQARRFAETFTWERAADETERHLRRVVDTRGAR